jgi:hypothetical protein
LFIFFFFFPDASSASISDRFFFFFFFECTDQGGNQGNRVDGWTTHRCGLVDVSAAAGKEYDKKPTASMEVHGFPNLHVPSI